MAMLVLAAGCLAPTAELSSDAAPAGLAIDPVVIDVPVHIVRVGLAADAVDERALLDILPAERLPIVESVEWTTRELRHLPVLYRFVYAVHDAPEGFVDAFFAKAQEHATVGRPSQWLVDYDCAGEQRLGGCAPVAALAQPADVTYFDVMPVEEWLLANADEFGLDFGPNAITILLLDGEGSGRLDPTSYHYWHFDDGMGHSDIPQSGLAPTVRPPAVDEDEHLPRYHTPKDPTAMRAWGGRGNMVWLDLTAAPSAYDFAPRWPVESWEDPPLWDVTPQEAAENVGRDLADLLALRVARDPIYPVTAFTTFTTPIHVFVEEGTQENPDLGRGADLEAWVPEEEIRASLQRLMPWATVNVDVMFHMLPADDAGMSEAIKRARAYGSPSHVSSGYVQAYIVDHWDEYVPKAAPDEFVMPQFYYFFAGPWTFNGFGGAGGWADGDEEGRPWIVMNHFFDLCTRTDVAPCTKNDLGLVNITLLPLHEAGHELGLTHTKDFVEIGDEGAEWRINWLWDSMFSQMSYRHTFMEFDHWDRVFIATSHAADLIERTESLGGDAREARRLLAEGAHADAVQAGWRALREAQASGAAAAAAGAREDLVDVTLEVPASVAIVPGSNLGVAYVANPLALDGIEGVSYRAVSFDVPEGAREVRVAYEDVTPLALATGRSSFVDVHDPAGARVGGISRDFEGSVVLRPADLPAGTWEARVYQWSGTPGLYRVSVSVG